LWMMDMCIGDGGLGISHYGTQVSCHS
jgi:hypothetical protein